jgi:digeranylgeranylglycerophospholipid reductase
MKSNVDVLVIGAGPGGSAAAWRVAEAGFSVTVVEKRSEIGYPVQCAELVPNPLIEFTHTPGVLRQRVDRMANHLPSGAVEFADFPGLMVDRAAFDQALASRAVAAGARILTACQLTAVRTDAAQADIAEQDGAEHTVHYRALIAADGPQSTVARLLGLKPLDVVHTRQYRVPLMDSRHHTDVWLSREFPGGYGWLFPRGDTANVGVGIDPRHGSDPKPALERLHADLVAQSIVGPEIIARTGGQIPVSGVREPLVSGNVVFVGDAAGLAHPISGAGIAAAVQSGEMAGVAVAEALRRNDPGALSHYELDIRALFGPTLGRAVARRVWLEMHWNTERADDDAVHRRGWVAFPAYHEV